MQIVRDVVQVLSSSAVQQQFEQSGDSAGPGVRQHLRRRPCLLLDGGGRRELQLGLRHDFVDVVHVEQKRGGLAIARLLQAQRENPREFAPGFRPSTMMRSASRTASSMLCVTMKMLRVGIFFACHKSSSSPRRFSAVSTSSAEKGSSMNKHLRLNRQRARKANALLHPTGKLLGIRVLETLQSHGHERAQGRAVPFPVRHPARQQRSLHIFQQR